MPDLPASQRLRLYDSDELDLVLQAMARQAATLLPPAVGVHLQVAAHDIVECNVPPYEMEFCIEVLRHGAALHPRGRS